jgi:hypothetical protein
MSELPIQPPRFRLPHAWAAWDTPDFDTVFKREVEQLDAGLLPLQQGLTGTSSVADAPFTVLLLRATAAGDGLQVKAGIVYAGILGGCSCADDPTPLEAQPEYCELWFDIDLRSGATDVRLATDA